MKKLISVKLAGNLLLIFLGLLLVFHILVLLGIIPASVIWGGQANSTNLVVLESIALVVTVLFLIIVAAKLGYILSGKFSGAVTVGLWIIFAYLILNTLGNLASGVSAENLVFAPLTLLVAFFALRLAIEK